MKYLFKPTVALVLLFSFAGAKEFIIDNAHSNVGFSVKHMMISNVKGNFNAYTADIDFDADKKVFNKLGAKIETASVDTGVAKRDDHLRSADFFDATKFKTIDFVMTSMKDGKVYGKITIHGVIKDFQGHQRVGFSLEGKLNRKDFGLTWNKVLEGGGLTVEDTVDLAIEVEAIEL